MKILKLRNWFDQKLLTAFSADSNSDQNIQIVSNCAQMQYRLKRKDIYPCPNINGSHGKDGNNNGKVGYETTDPVGKETLGFEFLQVPGYQKCANE